MEKLPCGGFSGLLPENGLIEGINHDDLEVLVGRILANQVGAQDTDSLDTTFHSLLSDGLQVSIGSRHRKFWVGIDSPAFLLI